MKCALCDTEFTPQTGQMKARWAETWCKIGEGLLCPPHHQAANELKTPLDPEATLGVLPWGSEILRKSEALVAELKVMESKVPEGLIVVTFGGVLAVSPKIYGEMLDGLAKQCGVECDETFRLYVSCVLKKQPSYLD